MTLLLYAATVLIWGSTWYIIRFQLNGTAEEVSVGIRFVLAALVLFGIAAISGRRLTIAREHWFMVGLQGILMFCLNYLFVYPGTNYITSGLMAVIFTLLIPANLINEYIFLRTPISGRVALSGVLGVAGVGLLFLPELQHTDMSGDALKGIGLGVAAVLFASLGNVAATINSRRRLPVTAVSAWGMLLGGVMSLVAAAAMGRSMSVQWDHRVRLVARVPGRIWLRRRVYLLSALTRTHRFGARRLQLRAAAGGRAPDLDRVRRLCVDSSRLRGAGSSR